MIPAVLVLPRFLGLDGLWVAMPVSDCLASLITGTCIMLEMRHPKEGDRAAKVSTPILAATTE